MSETTPQTRAEYRAALPTKTPNAWIPSPAMRRYFYRVLVAGAAVAAGYGIITAAEGGLWLSLGAAILGTGPALADRNTPKD